MGKKALITGVTGQDGSYLSEFLLSMDYEVHGLIRRSSSIKRERIDHISDSSARFFLHYGDLSDDTSIYRVLSEVKPDEIYNLGAQSHVRISFDTPVGTSDVVGIGTIRLLEAVKNVCPDARFYQASSSEMFGSFAPPQRESSPFHPRSPYAVSKLSAHWNVINYREGYNLFAVSGILFNHESPRRSENFVTRKIAAAAVAISRKEANSLSLGNLNSIRDWGYSPEYVVAMWKMLQLDQPKDFVVGTGIAASVEDFLNWCFEALNLDWRDYVVIDPHLFRPTEVDALIADPLNAKKTLGWTAQTFGKTLAEIMVESELKRRASGLSVVDPWIFGRSSE
jgi:GDPmannose 4,6-dehydratase